MKSRYEKRFQQANFKAGKVICASLGTLARPLEIAAFLLEIDEFRFAERT